MAQEAKTDRVRGARQLGRRGPISGTGFGITRWMIVRDRERATVVSQDDVENLTYGHHRSVNRSLGHDGGVPKSVRRIADENHNTLATLIAEERPSSRCDIASTPESRRRVLRTCQAPQTKCSHERCRLGWPDAWTSCELLWKCGRDAVNPAELREERHRYVDSALADTAAS
jgi:hypothetical protein